jgi:VIT1/CCC1 family predicted Fe2+/Mn2+ transporter
MSVKTIREKYLSMGRSYLVAYGLVLIIGVWLAIVAFIMRDTLHSFLFMCILLVIYVLTVHLYYSTHQQTESKTDRREPKINRTGLAAIQTGEHGITMIVPKRS